MYGITDPKHGGIVKRSVLAATLIAAVAAVIIGCNPFGTKDTEFSPHGTTFALNPQISLSRIDGYAPGYDPLGLFQLSIHVRSVSGSVETDTLVAGLFFTSDDDAVQHMLVVKQHVITVGPADTIITIGCFCCNSGLHAPDSADTYEVGPVTDNSRLIQIIDILRDKDVSAGLFTVQQAVWQVTDEGKLTQDMIDQLNALPADTL
jgi:hypothetical protein